MPKENELFEEDPGITPQPDPTDQEKDYLAELVGEGKKFKSTADLARGKAESDAFITRLLAEQKELRDDLKARQNLEELVAELQTQQKKPSASNEQEPPDRERDEKKTITPEDIEKVLDVSLTKREKEKTVKDNMKLVKTTLQKTLGNDYPDKLRQRAAQVDPNLTEEDLNNLAARNPNAFFKLLDIKGEQKVTNFNPPDSSVNSSAFSPSESKERTRSYYNRLKETDKVKYFSPAVRQQMYNDAIRLGEKFEDT